MPLCKYYANYLIRFDSIKDVPSFLTLRRQGLISSLFLNSFLLFFFLFQTFSYFLNPLFFLACFVFKNLSYFFFFFSIILFAFPPQKTFKPCFFLAFYFPFFSFSLFFFLFYSILFYSILFYNILFYTILFYSFYFSVLFSWNVYSFLSLFSYLLFFLPNSFYFVFIFIYFIFPFFPDIFRLLLSYFTFLFQTELNISLPNQTNISDCLKV